MVRVRLASISYQGRKSLRWTPPLAQRRDAAALPLPQRTALALSLDLDSGSFSAAYSQLLAAGNQRLGLLQGFLQVGASSSVVGAGLVSAVTFIVPAIPILSQPRQPVSYVTFVVQAISVLSQPQQCMGCPGKVLPVFPVPASLCRYPGSFSIAPSQLLGPLQGFLRVGTAQCLHCWAIWSRM